MSLSQYAISLCPIISMFDWFNEVEPTDADALLDRRLKEDSHSRIN